MFFQNIMGGPLSCQKKQFQEGMRRKKVHFGSIRLIDKAKIKVKKVPKIGKKLKFIAQ